MHCVDLIVPFAGQTVKQEHKMNKASLLATAAAAAAG